MVIKLKTSKGDTTPTTIYCQDAASSVPTDVLKRHFSESNRRLDIVLLCVYGPVPGGLSSGNHRSNKGPVCHSHSLGVLLQTIPLPSGECPPVAEPRFRKLCCYSRSYGYTLSCSYSGLHLSVLLGEVSKGRSAKVESLLAANVRNL